ncbi:MAG: relaxase/mobilization nuclease domain-containing protein [Ruminococcus sp.]|nr:relaxase/mobilization nuclease domain-containing protein [Ruminococcus sp.]
MAIIKAVSSKSPIKTAIAYVSKEEKTEQKLLSGYNLTSSETAYDEMQITKEIWNKTDGRTYKHFVQSFAPDEEITPEQAHNIAKEFVENCPQFKGFEVLIATHQDREHIHTHFILNSVSFEDGHKFQQKSTELQEMKDLSDKICLEHGFSLTQKGRTFDGKEREETTSYKKEQYRLLQRAEQGEVKSYVQDIALTVMDCREQANSREHFIKLMNANGYGVVWTDNRKYITFIDLARQKQGEKQCKIRNSKLEKYYHTDFSKEGLEREFEDNARKQQEEYRQANRASAVAQYGRAIISDTGTILKESGAVLNQSTAISKELRLDRNDTRTALRQADTKVKSSTASRVDREVERERFRVEEIRRLAEQAERERKELAEQSEKKSRGGFER